MDRKISRLPGAHAPDQLERVLFEVDVAIAVILAGAALSVQLCGLAGAEEAAFTGAVWAQAAGVAFRVRRGPADRIDLVIGPRVRTTGDDVHLEPHP
jgi:hypothetical protein